MGSARWGCGGHSQEPVLSPDHLLPGTGDSQHPWGPHMPSTREDHTSLRDTADVHDFAEQLKTTIIITVTATNIYSALTPSQALL